MTKAAVSSTRHMPNPQRPSYTLCGRRRETDVLVLPVTSQRERVGCKDCLRLDAAE